MKSDNKQFIIFKEEIERDGFKSMALPCGGFLSWESHLKVEVLSNGFILLGEAIPVKVDARQHLESLNHAIVKDVADVMQYFSGRWTLIWDNYIISDACALMGLYYSYDCVSSSLNLISEHTSHRQISGSFRRPSYGELVDWVVTPGTALQDVRRLLCCQYIERDEKQGFSAHHHDFVVPSIGVDVHSVNDELISCGDVYFHEVEKKFGSLVLPLTAGVDSRTLFAMMMHAGVKFSTMTFARDSMDRSDYKTPARISEICGIHHDYVRAGTDNHDMRKLWTLHTFGCCASEDENFLARGQFSAIPPSALMVRGNVWEISTCAWWKRLGHVCDLSSLRRSALRSMPGISGAAFDAWLKDCESYPRAIADPRDIIFFEQRESAWLGSLEQALDLLPFSHLAPVNSAYLLSLMLSLPLEERTDKHFQKRLIDSVLPQLSGIPYNSRTAAEWIKHYATQGVILVGRIIKKTLK